MNTAALTGILIPFAGTALGSACVFFMRKELGAKVQKSLTGYAGGVMVAASIWRSGDTPDLPFIAIRARTP